MHLIVAVFLVVFVFSMIPCFFMWRFSRRYFSALPTNYPWYAAFYSVFLSTVLLYFSMGVQELNGVVLMASLPVLSIVLTATTIVVLNLFRRNSGARGPDANA